MRPIIVFQFGPNCDLGCCWQGFPKPDVGFDARALVDSVADACSRAARVSEFDAMLGAYGAPTKFQRGVSEYVSVMRASGAREVWLSADGSGCSTCASKEAWESGADRTLHWLPTLDPRTAFEYGLSAAETVKSITMSVIASRAKGGKAYIMCRIGKNDPMKRYEIALPKNIMEESAVYGEFGTCMDWALYPHKVAKAPVGFDLHERRVVAVTTSGRCYSVDGGVWIPIGDARRGTLESYLGS